MAKRQQFELSQYQRQNRSFSDDLKRQLVQEIECKQTTVAAISKEYEVSLTAVYKWLYKFSKTRKMGHKVVIETESTANKLSEMREKINELERVLGRKQLEIDFQTKMIELAEEEYGVDIKKKYSSKQCSGSGLTENYTHTK